MKLTVLIPVFNEVKTIREAVEDARRIDAQSEIIVIDNYSTDGTRDILKSLDVEPIKIVFQDQNYGFGTSIEKGISLARGEYIYVHMSDREYHYSNCHQMLRLAEENNLDAVFGSRLKNRKKSVLGLIRERPEYIASFLCTFLINFWYRRNFTDVLGNRFYRRKSVLTIPITTHGIGFEFEHTSRMCKRGFKIGEIAVKYVSRPFRREKKIRPYHLLLALWVLFRVRYKESD